MKLTLALIVAGLAVVSAWKILDFITGQGVNKLKNEGKMFAQENLGDFKIAASSGNL